MPEQTIPVLDFRDWSHPERHEAFVQQLGDALSTLGFVAITDHGIPAELLDRAYAVAADVFALPSSTKRGYEDPEGGRERGYTSFGVEHAKDHGAPDLKEFWHVGRARELGNPAHAHLHDNRFPSEVPAFGEVFSDLYSTMERFAHSLLDGVGEYLGLPPSFFRDMVADGNSVMRIINYPDLGVAAPAGSVRAAQHEDINLMTVLPASTRPGLELLTHDGRWMPVFTPPGVMICDTGDMMHLVTAGRLQATTHRVVNPDGADGGRMSMPFFVHPRRDVMLTPLKEGFAEPVLAHDFLYERLAQIGVAAPGHAGADGRNTQSDAAAPISEL